MKQREIKFRAWDKKEKKMYPSVSFLDIWNFQPKGLLATEEYMKENVIVMQYTGLKDKTKWMDLTDEEQLDWVRNKSSNGTSDDWNGKEIYEGDIVKCQELENMDEIVNFQGEVSWQGSGFVVKAEERHFYELDFALQAIKSEIIGNIYEDAKK